MDDIQYYDSYEKKLLEELVNTCSSLGMMDRTLLETEDIDQKWKEFAPEYIAEALPDINTYPEVAIAWAGYLGMAVAKYWDVDWGKHHSDTYVSFHGPRGFDDMDDHIMVDILGHPLDSKEAKQLTLTLQACAQKAINFIRHEQIEHQTVRAFHIFARTARTLYKIGASLQLKQMGYRFEKVNLDSLKGSRLS